MKKDSAPPPLAGTIPSVDPRIALLCLAVLALVLTGLRIPAAISDPFFSGDAAHRMNMAAFPAIRMGSRVWLPALQIHIWLLHLLHAPYYAFKLIPCLYHFLSTVLLGALSLRMLGYSRLGLTLSLALVALFANQTLVVFLGTTLMQEIIELTLLVALLLGRALELKKRWWLLPLAAFALLTRETFWIYLFVMTLLNWKEIRSDRTYILSFLALWSVPLLWLLMTPVGHYLADGRWPVFPTQWPLGMNKAGHRAVSDVSMSLASVWLSLTKTGVAYFAATIFLLGIALRTCRIRKDDTSRPCDDFAARFAPFSLLSLVIVYSLTILFNPYQNTFGDSRMSAPLLFHGFVWAIILLRRSLAYPSAVKYLALAVLLAGIVPSTTIAQAASYCRDYTQVKEVYREIEHDLNTVAPIEELRVCIFDEDYFVALHALLKPTLHARRRILVLSASPLPRNCDVAFAHGGSDHAPVEGFKKYRDYSIDGRAYSLFVSQQ